MALGGRKGFRRRGHDGSGADDDVGPFDGDDDDEDDGDGEQLDVVDRSQRKNGWSIRRQRKRSFAEQAAD